MDFDWKKVKTEYITSDNSSYRKLAEKHGISLGTICKRAQREKWPELKKRHYDEKVTKTVSAVEEKEVKKMQRIQDITDRLLDKIEKAVEELDIQLFKDVKKVKEIEYNNLERPDKPTKEVIHEEETITEIHTIIDRKGAQELASAIKSLKEVQMLKTELDEQEQRARIEKLRKDAQEEQKDKTITVVLEGGIDEYGN